MFAEHGFAETSMRDISHQLDVTTAALYYHFENKDDLLLAAVTPALDDIDALLAKAPRTSAPSRRSFLSAYTDLLIKHQAAMRLINRDPAVASHPSIGPRLTAMEAEVAKHLSNRRGTRAKALSAAALGAVLMPILTLDRSELTGLTDVLVQGAMAVLGG